MKIALIQTPRQDFYTTPQRHYPLGLTCLAGAVRDLPADCDILDFLSRGGRQTLSVPPNFAPASKFYREDHGPLSVFYQYYHFGLSWQSIEKELAAKPYDIYALSANFHTYAAEVLQTAGIIRKLFPHAVIVLGGQAATDRALFDLPMLFDHFVEGEGEKSFRNLVLAYLAGTIPARILMNTEHCDSFTYSPAHELLPANNYLIAGKPAMMIETSRGCSLGCKFCCVANTFGKKQRLKSADDILRLMTEGYKRGIRAFDIEDDNFTLNRRHGMECLEKIIDQFNGGITLYAMNGLSAAHLDRELIRLMKRAGFKLLNLSVATVRPDLLSKIHRGIETRDITRAVQFAQKEDLNVMVHFIAGMPGQTLQEMCATLLYIAQIPAIPGISPFYYIPGMKLSVPNIPCDPRDARLTRFFPADNKWNELDLITLFRLSRWVGHTKKRMKELNISSCDFIDLPRHFPDDIFICRTVQRGAVLGLYADKRLYEQVLSARVMNEFMTRARDLTIRA